MYPKMLQCRIACRLEKLTGGSAYAATAYK